jgi:hypothetical protein
LASFAEKALDELRDHGAGAVLGAAHVVDGNDVRVLQASFEYSGPALMH